MAEATGGSNRRSRLSRVGPWVEEECLARLGVEAAL